MESKSSFVADSCGVFNVCSQYDTNIANSFETIFCPVQQWTGREWESSQGLGKLLRRNWWTCEGSTILWMIIWIRYLFLNKIDSLELQLNKLLIISKGNSVRKKLKRFTKLWASYHSNVQKIEPNPLKCLQIILISRSSNQLLKLKISRELRRIIL